MRLDIDEADDVQEFVDRMMLKLQRATKSALRVSAERGEETTDSDSGYVRRERLRRSVEREITLPSEVDPDSVRAELRNGVLRVTAEKTEDTGGRRVEVKSS